MHKIITVNGVSWLAVASPVDATPVPQHDNALVGIACVRCSNSKSWARSVGVLRREGWTKIVPYQWLTGFRHNHKGLCAFCRNHPEEELQRRT